MTSEDLETRRIRAEEARQFMANPLFREMFAGIEAMLEGKALACDPNKPEEARNVIISKQILFAMKREIERRVEDGDYAAFHIAQLERQNVVTRLFRR